MTTDVTVCPDCSYPPKFQYTRLPKTDDGQTRVEIHCRDCNDIWVEVSLPEPEEGLSDE